MKSRCALGAVLLCVFAFWTSACSTSTPGLPGERDVTRTGDGFASMPTIPETASLLQRDGYLQGAMLGRRYDVVFQMLTAQCRAVIGSAQGVEGHLGTWEELPKNLGYDQQRDADIDGGRQPDDQRRQPAQFGEHRHEWVVSRGQEYSFGQLFSGQWLRQRCRCLGRKPKPIRGDQRTF